jgi:hypothetical protein
VIEEEASVPRLSFGRWGLVVIAAAYMTGLVLVANAAFGTNTFLNRHATAPARTGGYDTRIPMVAAVNPDTMARSITEATGGAPTIGLPFPEQAPAAPAATQPASPVMTARTTPTYTAATRVSTISVSTTTSWTSLLSLIPTNLRFPPRAKPQRR